MIILGDKIGRFFVLDVWIFWLGNVLRKLCVCEFKHFHQNLCLELIDHWMILCNPGFHPPSSMDVIKCLRIKFVPLVPSGVAIVSYILLLMLGNQGLGIDRVKFSQIMMHVRNHWMDIWKLNKEKIQIIFKFQRSYRWKANYLKKKTGALFILSLVN